MPLAFEYEAACRFCIHDSDLAEEILNGLLESAILVTKRFSVRPLLRDPNDNMVLEAATNGQCEYVVTFNKKDFLGAELYGISVVTPGEFLTLIGR